MSPGPARLSRLNRLRRRADFTAITRARGKRLRDECFTVHTVHSSGAHVRLGVTVSKRVSTKAVTRNRIKRQIRESFRHHRHILNNLDVVVIAQPAAATTNNPTLRESLTKHWQQLSLICKTSHVPS
jgi:ribonuclease P protein component